MTTDPVTLQNIFGFSLYFRILRLQHVTVALQHRGHMNENSWTEQDRAAIARIIHEKIADPDGARAHAREGKKGGKTEEETGEGIDPQPELSEALCWFVMKTSPSNQPKLALISFVALRPEK
ncbi:MAG: hypothetical protein Q9208_004783 [Pyrenodesmia sp. 3 TL-2023]